MGDAHGRDGILTPAASAAANSVRRLSAGDLPALLATRAISAAIRTRLGHINADRAVIEHMAVELADGGARGLVVGHLYEAEALALAGGSVRRDGCLGDLTIRTKEREQILVIRRERQTSNVNASRHDGPFLRSMWRCRPWGDGIETTQSCSVCAPLQAFMGRSVERNGGSAQSRTKTVRTQSTATAVYHMTMARRDGVERRAPARRRSRADGPARSGTKGVSETESAGL